MKKLAQMLESDVDSLISKLLGGVALPSEKAPTSEDKQTEKYQLPVKHTKGGNEIDDDNKPWIVGTFIPGQYVNETHPGGHTGVDLKAPRGTPIYPIASGEVTEAREYGKGGKTVKILHEDGKVQSYYAHMDAINVAPGQKVEQSTVIGEMGDTGNAKGRGAHLHYEVKVNNSHVDPQSIVGKRVGSLSKKAEFIANLTKALDNMLDRKRELRSIIKSSEDLTDEDDEYDPAPSFTDSPEVTDEEEKPEGLQYDTLQPNDRVTVYHGTSLPQLYFMINGFDTNEIRPRSYGGPRHAGLFVTPSVDLAERFASRGEIILELTVPAKLLHGTDYSGNIGRSSDPHGPETMVDFGDYAAEKYPDSFRPQLALTLNQASEPQALLRGLVKPEQIARIRYKPYKKEPRWYSRDEFIDLGLSTKPDPYGPPREIKDVGYDVSYPNYNEEEFVTMLASKLNMNEEKVRRFLKRNKGRKQKLFEDLKNFDIGETAARRYSERFAALAELIYFIKSSN